MSDNFDEDFKPATSNKTRIAGGSGEWLKNATKSLGYSAMDIMSDVIPSTMEAVKTATELSQEFVENVRDMKTQQNRLKSSLDKNVYFELGRNLKNYALEDLRTGKFYNKERADSFDDDFDLDGFDIGGDDFDVESSVGGSDYSTDISVKKASNDNSDVDIVQVSTNINSNNPMVDAVKEQTRVSYEGANLIAEVSKSNQMINMNNFGAFSSQLGSQLGSIADNIQLITTIIGDTLSKHTSLSAKYYEDSMGAFGNILEELKVVSQQSKLSTANTTDMSSYKEYKNVLDTVFSAGGIIDIKEYANLVKDQFNRTADSNLVLSSIKGVMSQTDVLGEMVKNPLRFISDGIIKKFIPSMVQTAAEKFDKTFRETMVAGLYQIRNLGNSDNIIKEIIGKTFGIGNAMKSSIDKSNYNKGPVPFDGITHRTINDVIPYYLRRTVALLEGSQEVAFDYDKGTFDTVKNIQTKGQEDRDRRKLGGLSSVAGDFNDYLSGNYKFRDTAQYKEVTDSFTKLLTSMVNRDGGINFKRITHDDGSVRDDIAEILDINDPSSPLLNIIRGFFQGSDNDYNMATFGREALEARAQYDKYMKEQEANPLKFNTHLMDMGTDSDTHIEYDSNGKDFTRKAGLLGVDKFGKDIFYYLRQTVSMIAKGVGVYVLGGSIAESPKRGFNRVKDKPTEVINPHESTISEFKQQSKEYDDKVKKPTTVVEEEKLQKFQKKGKKVVDLSGSYDRYTVSEEQATELRSSQLREEEKSEEDEKPTFLSRLAAVKPDSAFSKLITKFDKFTKGTSSKLEGYFNKANDALFDLVFGSDKTKAEKGGSFLQRAFDGLKLQFSTFGSWMDNHILKPMYENLFGENGLFTRLKNTQLGQDISNAFKNIGDKLFGIKDNDGNRGGGVLSAVVNELRDGGKSVVQFFTGKEYTDSKGQKHSALESSVFGVFKNLAGNISDSFKDFIGVEKYDPSKSKTGNRLLDGVDSIWTTVKARTNDFMDDILGTPDSSSTRAEFSKFTNEMSEGMPTIAASGIAGAGLGLIPSLFIPGGLIGGAFIGTAMGIVSQSSKLKDMLFGPDVDGERTGGLINKEVQSFFKDNKLGIGMGLGAGVISSMGLLPSLFVPGGPIGGALIGGAISMANKSESLHKFLFGEDLDGNAVEGSISDKFKDMTGISLKDGFINAGIGAGIGAIGGFFLGGPIGGALMGSAAGLALSSEKFKTYLFGDKDPDTGKREGGMFGAIGGWTKEHLFGPLAKSFKTAQINLMGFIKKEMVAPFAIAMIPIKEEFKRFKDRLFGGIKGFFEGFGNRLNDSFDRFFGQPLGEFLQDKVLDPLSTMLSRIFGGLGKIIGAVASSPFKLLNAVADGLYSKHQKEGVQDHKDKSMKGLIKGVDEDGNKLSFMQRLKSGLNYVSPKQRREARFSEKGAYYKDQYDGKLEEYRRMIDADMDRKKMDLDHEYQSGKMDAKTYAKRTKSVEAEAKASKAKAPTPSDTQSTPANSGATVVDNTTNTTNNSNTTVVNNPDTDGKATVVDAPTTSKIVSNYITEDGKKLKTAKGVKATASKTSQSKVASGDFDNQTKPAIEAVVDDKVKEDAKVANDKSRGISKAKRDSLLVRMDKNLQIIADSTKDQLDGVGKNVFRIRKILQKHLGISDDDITGSANKDRRGFLGKLKAMIKNPLRGLKDMIMAPFVSLGNAIGSVAQTLWDTVKGTATVIKEAVSGLWGIAKGIGKGVLDLLSVPKLILEMGLEGLKMIGPAVAQTLKEGVHIFGKTIRTGLDLIGTGIKAVGVSIYEGAKGLGQMIAGGLVGLGNLMRAAGIITKDAVVAITKGVIKGTAFVGGGLIKAVTGTLGWGFDKLFGRRDKDGKRSRRVQRVVVEGGFLDKIKSIGPDSPLNPKEPTGDNSNKPMGPENVNNNNTTGEPVKSVNDTQPTVVDDKPDTDKNTKIGATDVSKEYGENVDGVVTGMKLHSEAQTEKFDRLIREKDIKDSRASVVNSGSYENKSAERAEIEKAENELSFRDRLLNGISGIGTTMSSYSDSWNGIFGKKGLISGLLMVGLPLVSSLIEKMLDWFKGKRKDDDSGNPIVDAAQAFLEETSERDNAGRVDGEGNVYESNTYEDKWRRMFSKGGAKAVDFFTGRGGKVSRYVYSKLSKNPKFAKEFFTKVGLNVVDENGEIIAKEAFDSMATSTAKKLNKQAQEKGVEKVVRDNIPKVVDNISTGVGKVADNSIVRKFTGIVQKWFDYVLDSSIVKKLLSSKAVTSIKSALKKMLSGLGEFIIKSGSKFMVKIGSAIAQDGSLLFPPLGAIIKTIFGTVDFITGMTTDAGKIFQVAKQDVTFGMRISAGLSKLIMGYLECVNLCDEVYRIWTDGKSLREYLAEAIYKLSSAVGGFLIGSNDNIQKLRQSQVNFKTGFDNYNEELRAAGKEEMSFMGYIDKEHESMGSKVNRQVGKTFNFKDDDGNNQSYTGWFKDNARNAMNVGKSHLSTVASVFDLKNDEGKIKSFREYAGDIASNGVDTAKAVDVFFGKLFGLKDEEGKNTSWSDWFTSQTQSVGNAFVNGWKMLFQETESVANDVEKETKKSGGILTTTIGGLFDSVSGFFKKADDQVNKAEVELPRTSSSPRYSSPPRQRPKSKSEDKPKSIFDTDTQVASKEFRTNNIMKMADMGGEAFSSGDANKNDVHQGFSYYSQGDPRWGKKDYLTAGKDRSMKFGGCGPTSLAMVISQLTGEPVDPYEVGKEARSKGMVDGSNGTTWSAMTKLPEMAGIPSKFIGGDSSYRYNDGEKADEVENALKENKPVILSGNKRSGVDREDSPFTTGGHFVVAHAINKDQVMINDPRSVEDSKIYDFNEVMKETKGAWSYPRNTRAVNPNWSSSEDEVESLGAIGLFTGALDAFFKPVKELLYGKKKDDEDGSYEDGESGTTDGYAQLPSTVRGSIASKTAELMRQNESSNNYAIAKNDKTGAGQMISPSIGVLQWREGNAKELMRRMHEQLPNDPEASYYANEVNWSDRKPWSTSQLNRYKDFMNRNKGVSKMVQDKYAVEHVDTKILPNVYKHGVDTGKIRDPRSIVMLADISQTGPAHVDGFFNGKWSGGKKYPHGTRVYNTSVPAGKTEFDHFNSEIRSPETSYWGKYITTYKSRFDKSYNALKSWNAHDDIYEGPQIMDRGGDEQTPVQDRKSSTGVSNFNKPLNNTKPSKVNDDIFKAPQIMDKGGDEPITTPICNTDVSKFDNHIARDTVKYVNGNTTNNIIGSVENISILKEVVGVLKDILVENRGMNKGIDRFNTKKFPEASSNVNNIIMDASTQNNVNKESYGTVGANKTKTPKQVQKSIFSTPEYKLARQIASGITT